MTDEPYQYPHSVKSLNVLNASAKVEELRQEVAARRSENPDAPDTPASPQAAPTVGPQTVPAPAATPAESSPSDTIRRKLLEGQIIAALQTVYDPEIPINIYELGLIYSIDIDDKNAARVKMTLTAPGCPVAGSLPAEVQRKVASVPEVTDATVDLVWDPPWDQSRMSEAARLTLGMF